MSKENPEYTLKLKFTETETILYLLDKQIKSLSWNIKKQKIKNKDTGIGFEYIESALKHAEELYANLSKQINLLRSS